MAGGHPNLYDEAEEVRSLRLEVESLRAQLRQARRELRKHAMEREQDEHAEAMKKAL